MLTSLVTAAAVVTIAAITEIHHVITIATDAPGRSAPNVSVPRPVALEDSSAGNGRQSSPMGADKGAPLSTSVGSGCVHEGCGSCSWSRSSEQGYGRRWLCWDEHGYTTAQGCDPC